MDEQIKLAEEQTKSSKWANKAIKKETSKSKKKEEEKEKRKEENWMGTRYSDWAEAKTEKRQQVKEDIAQVGVKFLKDPCFQIQTFKILIWAFNILFFQALV